MLASHVSGNRVLCVTFGLGLPPAPRWRSAHRVPATQTATPTGIGRHFGSLGRATPKLCGRSRGKPPAARPAFGPASTTPNSYISVGGPGGGLNGLTTGTIALLGQTGNRNTRCLLLRPTTMEHLTGPGKSNGAVFPMTSSD